jgi:hypothetical protein
MPVTLRHAIVCDDVRVENNGKFFIIGMYTPDLSVPQIPTVVPMLTFLLWLDSDRPANLQFRATLSHLETGQAVAQAIGGMNIARPGTGISPIRFPAIQFNSAGVYSFEMHIEGQAALVHHFSVLLNIPVVQQPGLLPGLPGLGR